VVGEGNNRSWLLGVELQDGKQPGHLRVVLPDPRLCPRIEDELQEVVEVDALSVAAVEDTRNGHIAGERCQTIESPRQRFLRRGCLGRGVGMAANDTRTRFRGGLALMNNDLHMVI
jgi:hypothetical protein